MTSLLFRRVGAALAVAVAGTMVGCGGDGGGNAMPEGGYTLSGTISIPENAAVDSDTNDPYQVGRKPNNSAATAQGLTSPTYLIGSVNEPNGGNPDGHNFTSGDLVDLYQVDLKAGQVIELEFTADPTANDLDLIAFSSDGTEIGYSDSSISRYECLRVVTPGQHYIMVEASRGASVYNLRIGSPNDGSTCANPIEKAAGIVPGEVVAKAATTGDGVAALRAKALAAGGLTVAEGSGNPAVPVLLRLPNDRAERVAAFTRLTDNVSPAVAASGAVRKQIAAARAAALASAANDLPASVRDVIDTVHYAKQLARSGGYAYAEPNATVKLQALVEAYPPNDRLYTNQRWHYEMINLPGAMATLEPLQGQLTVRPIVAVIDSGIVADHPDFAGQIFAQASFTGGTAFSTSADDPSRPGDPTGFHGTHVAGTIAAATFNGIGVAGVAPSAQLLPIRVFAQGASLSNSSDIAQAILYAARLPNRSGQLPARRADVINMSLGSERACPAAYADAINQAIAAGVIVVAASGNDGGSVRNAPANCPGVISVGAVDARKQKAYYSNTDADLSLTAPGGDARVSTTGTGLPDEVYSTLGDFDVQGKRVPSYGGNQGTSMATPHVAGVMALMRYANPAITVAQVKAQLSTFKLTDDLFAAGADSASGYGLINASKAVNVALGLRGVTPIAVPGVLVAQPRALDFGAVRTSADLQVAFQGDKTAEAVTGVVSSSPAVIAVLKSFDTTARVWTYTVTVDRAALPLGSTFATLRIATTDRQIDVQISVLKVQAGSGSAADFGEVYVLVIDPDNPDAVVQAAPFAAVNGKYQWRVTGVKLPRVQIVAGTDVDNDGFLCQRGEACGGYPQFGADLTVLDLTGDRTGLDFEVTPYGVSAATAAASARSPVFRRAVPKASGGTAR